MSQSKLVFVSGAGRGIGRAIAIKLSEDGFVVSGCSRTLSELKETQSLSKNKIRISVVDITDSKSVKNWFAKELKETKITPWGLVAAAGVQGPVGPFIKNSFEDWKKSFETNLYGTALLVKEFSQNLIDFKTPGRIVLMSGGGATAPRANFTSYASSKVAVVRFGETMAHELREYNITVNSIAPGAVNTHLTEEVIKAGPEKLGKAGYEEVMKQKKSGGTSPDHAANLCSYLLSEIAAKVTGRLIAAVWDPWSTLHERGESFDKSDIYTLRRILPEDRKQDWSK